MSIIDAYIKPLGYLGRTPLGDLYQCRYTGHVALEKHMRFMSAVLPQCPVSEAITTLPSLQELAIQKRRESISSFNEMDANCNTCKYFNRQKSDNNKGSNAASNFVYGACINPNGRFDLIPYQRSGYQVMCHVADYMGMECWSSRE